MSDAVAAAAAILPTTAAALPDQVVSTPPPIPSPTTQRPYVAVFSATELNTIIDALTGSIDLSRTAIAEIARLRPSSTVLIMCQENLADAERLRLRFKAIRRR